MKLFDFFRRKRPASTPDSHAVSSAIVNGIRLSPELSSFKNQIEQSAVPFIRIEAEPAEQISRFESSFAGTPYWPAGKTYPTDAAGHPMLLLAQLNFSEIPTLPGYPERGLLQFYVSVSDDCYGINFNNLTDQSNFRVVYFESVDKATAENEFAFLKSVDRTMLPVAQPMRLQFSRHVDYVGSSDVQFQKNFGTDLYSFAQQFGDKSDAIGEELCDNFSGNGHKIGGYAHFTQDDPRSYRDEFKEWVLLLQIDSQNNDIMWGDVGVGNFFIHPDALQRKDFSAVLYTWDCC